MSAGDEVRMPASVFVTGGNGFMGRAVMERFRAAGVEVRGVDMHPDPDRGVVRGDICDPTGWRDRLAGVEVVVHTAAIVSNNIARDRAWCVNVVGTQHVVDAAAHAGVQRFVHVSTMGVARFAQTEAAAVERCLPGRELDERWPLMPMGNPYTDTKIAGEHVVLAAHAAGRARMHGDPSSRRVRTRLSALGARADRRHAVEPVPPARSRAGPLHADLHRRSGGGHRAGRHQPGRGGTDLPSRWGVTGDDQRVLRIPRIDAGPNPRATCGADTGGGRRGRSGAARGHGVVAVTPSSAEA